MPTSLTLTLWFQHTDTKELTLLLQHTDTEGIYSDDGFHGVFFFHMIRALTMSEPFAPLGVSLLQAVRCLLRGWAVSDCLVIAGEGLVPTECELGMLSSLWAFPNPAVLSRI